MEVSLIPAFCPYRWEHAWSANADDRDRQGPLSTFTPTTRGTGVRSGDGLRETHGWMPIVPDRTYSFDEIPDLASDVHAGKADVFPVYAVNEPRHDPMTARAPSLHIAASITFRGCEARRAQPRFGYHTVMSPVIDRATARAFAAAWIATWNSGDLERIFALYRDDFEMRSPLIAERGFSPTGVLRGKEAVRPYWSAGIASAVPPLRFELIDAYGGVNTIAIHYRSVVRKHVVEVIELDDEHRAIRGSACHGAEASA
jgi:hypothetical protein